MKECISLGENWGKEINTYTTGAIVQRSASFLLKGSTTVNLFSCESHPGLAPWTHTHTPSSERGWESPANQRELKTANLVLAPSEASTFKELITHQQDPGI